MTSAETQREFAAELVATAEKLGRLMVADMAEHAASILRRNGDHHGASVLDYFGNFVRADKDPSPFH